MGDQPVQILDRVGGSEGFVERIVDTQTDEGGMR
jgi:hypothetical protein